MIMYIFFTIALMLVGLGFLKLMYVRESGVVVHSFSWKFGLYVTDIIELASSCFTKLRCSHQNFSGNIFTPLY